MGASIVGTLKTVMLIVLLFGTGAWLWATMDAGTFARWWQDGRMNLVAPEAKMGWAQGASMVVGIFSTQAYLQPIFAGRYDGRGVDAQHRYDFEPRSHSAIYRTVSRRQKQNGRISILDSGHDRHLLHHRLLG